MDETWLKAVVLFILCCISVLGAWMLKSEAQSETPAAPLPERAPAEHEVKAALAEIRASVERLQTVLERQHEGHEDELRSIRHQLDRIESGSRLTDVLLAMRKLQP